MLKWPMNTSQSCYVTYLFVLTPTTTIPCVQAEHKTREQSVGHSKLRAATVLSKDCTEIFRNAQRKRSSPPSIANSSPL
jgi:hypothetical protein